MRWFKVLYVPRLSTSTVVPISPERALLWGARGSTFRRLLPPWVPIEVSQAPNAGQARPAIFTVSQQAPWVVRRRCSTPARELHEEQLEGPFARWHVVQRFSPHESGCVVHEELDYELPLAGSLSPLGRCGTFAMHRLLARIAAFRSMRIRADLERHGRYVQEALLSVAVEGNGIVARRLVTFLESAGHRVSSLSGAAGASEFFPALREAQPLSGHDALVYFCDFGWPSFIGRPEPSAALRGLKRRVKELSRLADPPRVLLLVTSACIYGDHGEQPLGEHAKLGRGDLPAWAQDCERAGEPLVKAGIRVVHVRLGFPLGGDGGLLPRLRRVMRFGLGAGASPGSQFWSWIAADDAVGALHRALFDETLRGPVNVTSPDPMRAEDVAATLASILQRRTGLQWPVAAMRTAIGSACTQWLTASVRAEPRALLQRGFEFAWPTLTEALRYELGRLPIHDALQRA